MGANETDLAWFRFYGRRWRDGTRSLTLEERGAYVDIITLIMDAGGQLLRDDRVLAGYLCINVRKFRPILKRLIDAGKITITRVEMSAGCREYLGTSRCTSETLWREVQSQKQRDRIAKRWAQRAEKQQNQEYHGIYHGNTTVYTTVIPGEEKRGDNPFKALDSGSEEAILHERKLAPDGKTFPAPGRRADGTNPRANGTDLRSRGANPRAVRAVRTAAEQQRIDDVDPDHQARVAAWAVSRGIDLASISQTDIERARELGLLPDETDPVNALEGL